MKTMALAVRNLSRQKKRSILLGGAIAFGFFIVTIIDSLSAGVIQNMGNKFAWMFGAHVIVQGAEKDASGKILSIMRDDDSLLQALKESALDYTYVSERSSLYGTFIFEGKKTNMNVFGCDSVQEKFLADSFEFVSGSWENMKQENGIIIGEAIAKELGIEVGDNLLIQTSTVTGQANAGEFIIAAISRDSSLLSNMAAYANMSYVNQLIGIAPDEFLLFNIMLRDQSKQDEAAVIMESKIREKAPVTSRTEALKTNPSNPTSEINKQLEKTGWDGTIYSVFSLNDYMPQLKQMLGVIQGVSTGILLVLFLVVMVGISNTFKMIMYERVREIGTMRAVGMYRKEAGRLFKQEAVLLAAAGALAGFVLAVIAMSILGLFTFNSSELSMFLHNGHWGYILSPVSILAKFILIIALTILAVSGSARAAAKMNPADALRTVK